MKWNCNNGDIGSSCVTNRNDYVHRTTDEKWLSLFLYSATNTLFSYSFLPIYDCSITRGKHYLNGFVDVYRHLYKVMFYRNRFTFLNWYWSNVWIAQGAVLSPFFSWCIWIIFPTFRWCRYGIIYRRYIYIIHGWSIDTFNEKAENVSSPWVVYNVLTCALLWTPNRFDIFYSIFSIGFPLECFW